MDLSAYPRAEQTTHHSHLTGFPEGVAHGYLQVAKRAAQALPEKIPVELFHVWVTDLRGESFPISEDIPTLLRAFQEFLIWAKEIEEAAERAGGLDGGRHTDYLPMMLGNYYLLLQQDKVLNLRGAHLRMCDFLRKGHRFVGPENQIHEAYEALKCEIFDWLAHRQIRFQREPSLVEHLMRAAAERVPPSISEEQQQVYVSFTS